MLMMAVIVLQSCDDEATTQVPTEKFGKIEGVVTDQNGVPVRSASITTNPATSTVTTDSVGKFTLSNVLAGSYSITASKDGATKSQTVSVVTSLTTTANFTLSVVPVNGLVAYYPFNGDATDKSGNNYNGTVGGALLTTDRFGNQERAYQFDGDDDYIAIENATGTKLEPKDAITLSCFIRADGLHGENPFSRIIRKTASFNNGYELSWEIGGNSEITAKLLYNCIPVQFSTPSDGISFNNTTLINEWHHIAMTYSTTTHILKLYIDGILSASKNNCNYDFQHSLNTLFIGGSNGLKDANNVVVHESFPGKIDDVRIYERALTDLEINALYHEGGF